MRTGRQLWTCGALVMCLGLFAANPAVASPVFALSAGEPAPQGGVIGVPTLADPVLWYNGDWDLVTALANEYNTVVTDAVVYDNFIVPAGETWEVQRIWTNDILNFSPDEASWEIRQGVSAGDGGTLIASGTDVCDFSPTGRNGFDYDEYTVEIQGLSIVLGEGEYWLAVTPIGLGGGRSFCTTTSGGNAIGQPQGDDGDAYFISGHFGYSFEPATNVLGARGHDFSMGVAGEVRGAAIPEPATLTLLALGGLGRLRRRRRKP